MHRMHHGPQTKSGPETTGATIHWVPQYDIFASLMGLGVNGSNSRMIIEMSKIKPGDKILDVGCGTGDLTLTAKKYAGASGSAYGIDPSPEGIDIARKKAKHSGAHTHTDDAPVANHRHGVGQWRSACAVNQRSVDQRQRLCVIGCGQSGCSTSRHRRWRHGGR